MKVTIETTRQEFRQAVIDDAKAYNIHLKSNLLDKYSDDEIICFVHPLDRDDHRKILSKIREYESTNQEA